MEDPVIQRPNVVWVDSLNQVRFLQQQLGKLQKDIRELRNKAEVCKKQRDGLEENLPSVQKENIEKEQTNTVASALLDESINFCKQLVYMNEKLRQDKKKYILYIHDTRKENSKLKATLNGLQNEMAAKCEEKAGPLEEERIYSKIKIEELEMQLAMKTQQIVMFKAELNECSKLQDEERNRCEKMKSALDEYEKMLVDASSLRADNDMLYKSLENERKESEKTEFNLLKEIETLQEKLEKAQQDILDHQVQMATINKISEESCAKYIRNCSLPDRANIEKEFSRTKAQEERITKETAKILTRYASKRDSIKTFIDRFEKYDYKQQRPLKTCEESPVNIDSENLLCSEESFIKNVEKEMLSLEGQDCHKIEQLTPQKQISQTIVQADKVFYINSAVSHHINDTEAKAIEESF